MPDKIDKIASRLTWEALLEVDAGQVIDHNVVQSWAESLDTDRPQQPN